LRIISGKYRGRYIPVPTGLRARPTTDFAREGLFNILANRIDFEGLRVLDLFGGSGSISLEFASRGAGSIDYVECEQSLCRFLRKTSSSLGIDTIRVHRRDVFRFLDHAGGTWDLVFADPPYQMDAIAEIPDIVLKKEVLTASGIFILEHGKKHDFSGHPRHTEIRKYGNVHFSFFEP